MKFILTFCFCILAFSESIESKNKKLKRTNEVLLKTLRELAVGEESEVGFRHPPPLPFTGDFSCLEWPHNPSDCCWTGYYVPPNPPKWVTSQGYSCHGGRVLAKSSNACLCVAEPDVDCKVRQADASDCPDTCGTVIVNEVLVARRGNGAACVSTSYSCQPGDGQCVDQNSIDSSWSRVALVADVSFACLPNDWCDQTVCTNQFASQGVATWEDFAKHVSSESGTACLERVSADSDCGDYAFFKPGNCFCTRVSGSNDCVRTGSWAGHYEVHTRRRGLN